MAKRTTKDLVPVIAEQIDRLIFVCRGERVILDRDLAALYGVTTKVLNQAVRRNIERFPPDFLMQLEWNEAEEALRSQFVTLDGQSTEEQQLAELGGRRGKHSKFASYAFTEQGVAMLSSVLRSPQAVAVNVEIMRAFVRMRSFLASHADLARKVDSLEKKYDAQFRGVFDAIRELMTPPAAPAKRRKIGFNRGQE